MAAPPVTLFSQHRKAEEVLHVLEQRMPDAVVETDAEGVWSSVKGAWKRGWLKGSLHLEARHSPEYYAGDGWSAQLAGMAGYFGQFPDSGRCPDVFSYIPGLTFALSFMLDPGTVEDDPRQEVISEIARLIDGVMFLPGCLLDAEGRVIISATDDPDPEARLPYHQAHDVYEPEDGPGVTEDAPVEPPSQERVINRLLLLGSLVNRGFMEQHEVGEDIRLDAIAGLQESEAWAEGDPEELRLLQAPVGALSEKEAWKLPWLSEGAVVIAWALGILDLPPYDEQVEVQKLFSAIDDLEGGVIIPRLRPLPEIEALSAQMLAVHWRLRQFSLDQKPMDFAEYATRAWFGPLELTLARLKDNDLEINGVTLSKSPEDNWKIASGIMEERRMAVHWLLGENPMYSENDTST